MKTPHMIYGTNIDRAMSEIIEDWRNRLVKIRGEMHDVIYSIGNAEPLESLQGYLTTGIIALHYEIEKAQEYEKKYGPHFWHNRLREDADKIQWPEDPKEGDLFSYQDPIGGSSFVFFEYRGHDWAYLRTE